MINQCPPHVKIEHVPFPLLIAEHRKYIHLYIYIFHFNGVTFLHTRSGKIKFHSAKACVSIVKVLIIKGLENFKQVYDTRGFNLATYHGDNKFEIRVLVMVLLPGLLSIFTKDEHVQVVERSIQDIKD